MTKDELKLLHTKLESSTCYLEYGSGKSTEYVATLESLDLIVSVESDKAFWNDRVLSNPIVRKRIERGELKPIFPNLGETGAWGVPTGDDLKFLWPNYALSPHNNNGFDLILVDGRFRVACILASALALPECDILVHDFWQRKKYHIVLQYCDVIGEADTMVCLRAKSDADKKEMSRILSKYIYNPIDSTKKQRLVRDVCMKVLGKKRTIKLIQTR